jgi:Tfp pilus assembly protein PilX
MLRARLASEQGWALVTALLLMTMMMSAGLAVASYLDNEGNQSRIGRNRESSFNLAEGALNAQVFALAQSWPGVGTPAVDRYSTCTQASSGGKCPNNTQLLGMFPTSDTSTGVAWTTTVRDNNVTGAPNFYSDSLTATAAGYDQNDDGTVWVRAEATARGKTRTLVALVRAEQQYEDIPRATLLTGSFSLGNNGSNGNKQFIDNGTSAVGVETRCVPSATPAADCAGRPYDDSKYFPNGIQTAISPYRYSSDSTLGNAVSSESLQRLIKTARSSGNYYTSCPSSAAGEVVVVDVHTSCNLPASSSPATPGMVIMLNSDSTLSAGGNTTFYGVIYHANQQNSSNQLVSFTGNVSIFGGILIDGQGALYLQGSSTLGFDANAFNAVRSVGSAGIVQNTWRELSSR